jgi:CTP synthase
MIAATKYARRSKIPFLGICLGFQISVIEFACNVCGLNADSIELDHKTPNPSVIYMPGLIRPNLEGQCALGAG